MIRRKLMNLAVALGTLLSLGATAPSAFAEAKTIRISHGYGLLYLPLMVMRDQNLIEKHSKAMGLGDVTVNWAVLDGGNVINDAMLAGSLDIAGTGAPGFIGLWAKARGIPNSEVVGLSALSTSPIAVNTNNPSIKTLRDFGPKDKIAVPGIKSSVTAVILQMLVAHEFGMEDYDKLDPLTVSLSHPEATASLLSGKTEINAHVASPPFLYQELADPKIHKVIGSNEVLGNITIDVVFASKRFVDANPKLTAAFLAAQEEANTLIAGNRKTAAEIFVKVAKVKSTQADIEKMLDDKNTEFTTTPTGIMEYVLFMSKAGTIKTKPAVWSDAFVPALKTKKGS